MFPPKKKDLPLLAALGVGLSALAYVCNLCVPMAYGVPAYCVRGLRVLRHTAVTATGLPLLSLTQVYAGFTVK